MQKTPQQPGEKLIGNQIQKARYQVFLKMETRSVVLLKVLK